MHMHWETDLGTDPLPGEKTNSGAASCSKPETASRETSALAQGAESSTAPGTGCTTSTCFKSVLITHCAFLGMGGGALQDSSILAGGGAGSFQPHLPGKSCHWILWPNKRHFFLYLESENMWELCTRKIRPCSLLSSAWKLWELMVKSWRKP